MQNTNTEKHVLTWLYFSNEHQQYIKLNEIQWRSLSKQQKVSTDVLIEENDRLMEENERLHRRNNLLEGVLWNRQCISSKQQQADLRLCVI